MRNFFSLGIAAGLLVAATSFLAPTPSEARTHGRNNIVRVGVNPGYGNYGYPYNYGNYSNYTNYGYPYGGAAVNPSDPHSWYFWAQPSGPSAAAPFTNGYPYANNYGNAYGNYYSPTQGGLLDDLQYLF